MPALPDDVRTATSARYSLVSRRQLLELGYAGSSIDRWIADGLLVRRSRGHYLVGGATIEAAGRLVTALDRCGDGARIGGPWACGLHGLEGFDLSGNDHVIIDPRRRVTGVSFTVVRSPVPPVDQATVDDLPTLTVTRSLIDIAPTHPAKKVRVAFDSARRSGLTSLDELTQRATELGRVRGAPEMRRIIASGLLRMESEGERQLHGLWLPGDPKPEPQVWVFYRSRLYRLDFAFLDARLCLEYDGRDYHERALDRYRDYDRDLALAELRIQTLRISARMLRTPERTRRQILAVRQNRLQLGLPPIAPATPPK